MENIKNNNWLIGGGILIFAILFFFAARGFSNQGSYVEVKGLSEKIVKADVAIWSMGFDVKSNNVDALYADIEKNINIVKSFLKEKGFEDAEINTAPINVYQDTWKDAVFRYNTTVQLSVYSKKVDTVRTASEDSLLLVRRGVTLNQNYISFEYSDINAIKPEMLAEAIKNARISAQEFAEASGSSVGGISRGNQGVFDISEKDPASPEYKKIRVVSTLRFLLK